MRSVVLVGYRGCGKSSVAKRLARSMQVPLVDTDDHIVARAGCSIPDLFASEGEAGFRDREVQVLADVLSEQAPQVVATGGGIVERAENRDALQFTPALVAYLQAPAAVLAQRLQRNSGDRPSLTGRPVDEEVATMLARRDPWYRAVAGVVIDAGQPLSGVVDELYALVTNSS